MKSPKRCLTILLFAVLIVCLWRPATVCGQDNKGEKPAKKMTEKEALEQRIKALEAEEKGLSEMAKKLKKGVEVETKEVEKIWNPPAVYLVEDQDPVKKLDMADQAVEIAEKMLQEKDLEWKQLQLRKAQAEGGRSLGIVDIEDPTDYGTLKRVKELKEDEEELLKLEDQLKKAQEANRFLNAADLDKPLDAKNEKTLKDPQTLRENTPFIHEKLAKEKTPEQETLSPTVQEKKDEGIELAEAPDKDELKLPFGVDLPALGQAFYLKEDYKNALTVFKRIDHSTHKDGDRILYMIGRSQERLADQAAQKGEQDEADNLYRIARGHYLDVEKNYPGSFWASRTKFAVAAVAWKLVMTVLRCAPPEAYYLLRAKQAEKIASKVEVK